MLTWPPQCSSLWECAEGKVAPIKTYCQRAFRIKFPLLDDGSTAEPIREEFTKILSEIPEAKTFEFKVYKGEHLYQF